MQGKIGVICVFKNNYQAKQQNNEQCVTLICFEVRNNVSEMTNFLCMEFKERISIQI